VPLRTELICAHIHAGLVCIAKIHLQHQMIQLFEVTREGPHTDCAVVNSGSKYPVPCEVSKSADPLSGECAQCTLNLTCVTELHVRHW
jgi:hypothetical protein